MIRILSIILGIVAIAAAFYSNIVAWIIYGVPAVYLVTNLWAMKKVQAEPIEGISDEARKLISKYPYWYTYPNVAKDNGAAARALVLFGALLGGLSYFGAFKWGLVISGIAIIAMLFVSRKIDPIRYVRNPAMLKAHEEIVAFMLKRPQVERTMIRWNTKKKKPLTVDEACANIDKALEEGKEADTILVRELVEDIFASDYEVVFGEEGDDNQVLGYREKKTSNFVAVDKLDDLFRQIADSVVKEYIPEIKDEEKDEVTKRKNEAARYLRYESAVNRLLKLDKLRNTEEGELLRKAYESRKAYIEAARQKAIDNAM